jgi:exodeoxyribonuclease VII large subunit
VDAQVIGVKEFLDILNETLTFAFPSVTVEGEVSSYKVNQGKWVFFDLKDDDATLSCFMPIYQLKVPLEDGMRVRVTGVPKLTKWGKFSFTARSVELAGEGELRRAFELLKQRLGAEGLFAPERKRPLPAYPRTIGLITSGTSAAYADFLKILAARWGGIAISLADVTVQGQSAPDQIIGAINYFNQTATPPDVLVLIRGGGSLEDLQAFSTEAVARAVASARVPIVVGVGHEVDTSLADMAADVRAATPTDAARLVVPDRTALTRQATELQNQLSLALPRQIRLRQERLAHSLRQLTQFIVRPRMQVEQSAEVLNRQMGQLEQSLKQRLDSLARVLGSFDPEQTLKRGYAIVRSNGKIVKQASTVSAGSGLVIQLADGKLNAKVENHDQN